MTKLIQDRLVELSGLDNSCLFIGWINFVIKLIQDKLIELLGFDNSCLLIGWINFELI